MAGRVTISDIAKAARVSKTTISRYLNGNYGYMSVETRARIEEIIEKYNYVPNGIARTLKSKKSGMIGVIVNTLRYQVGAQTVTGINDICTKNGVTAPLCTAQMATARPKRRRFSSVSTSRSKDLSSSPAKTRFPLTSKSVNGGFPLSSAPAGWTTGPTAAYMSATTS